jgi:hypothetical protein
MVMLVLVVIALLAACGRIQQGAAQEDDGKVGIELEVQPAPPRVGPATLIISLADQQGQPIKEATLAVEGNMTHAGMVPVMATVTTGEEGRYTVPFEWSMGGDWIVTVQATLADGRSVTRDFNVSVE